MCAVGLTTTAGTVLYTAPAASSNVTSPSATAYVKEIILSNTTTGALTATVNVNGVAILSGVSIAANDTKVLSGLSTALNAGSTITGSASATGINCVVSGTEVQ